MTVSCPSCGRPTDPGDAKPGSTLTCPGCRRQFQLSVLPDDGSALPLQEPAQDDPPPSIPEAPNRDSTGQSVLCPICKTRNPADVKVCTHCGAILRRKRWAETTGVPSSSAAGLPVKRRHLTLLLLFSIGLGLLVGVVWLAGRLLTAVETPSLAYMRMAGMASNGDWGRFCDRVHPRTQQSLVAMAQSGSGKETTARRLFAGQDFGRAFMAIQGLPYKDFTITKEDVQGDKAMLTVKCTDGRQQVISMAKDQGLWKLVAPEIETPGR